MSARGTNGRPEPEVIVNFSDGYSYSKGKMEEVFRSGIFDKPPAKPHKETYAAKKEDVEVIVSELDITRLEAERALAKNNGDVQKALLALITP
ncbi:hypothetical protein BD410DRAFT_785646 [Rickenella mellea]|uniref:Nascent polypeptide-associated complex subunit alpha-like UBA domain-containing protein n=1 Tax=Rickenella mellea TaxID=50990 RepID=A0A4Y7QB63_9AGAM|nr:hypothetical protein BD410DRAFT_785646 [Rickenella mellea]